MAKKEYNTTDYWKQQINGAKLWKKKYAQEDRWRRNTLNYEHVFARALEPNFNLILMQIASILPSTVFQTPHVVNTARRPDFGTWAQFFDSIDNWCLKESRLHSILKQAIIEAFLKNIFCLQLGYDFPDQVVVDQQNRMREMEFPHVEGALDFTRRENQPWFDLIRAEDLLLSVGTQDTYSMRWYAKKIILPVRVAKELPHFIASKIKATHEERSQPKEDEDYADKAPEDLGYIEFYEVHNVEKGEWFFFTDDDFLMKPKEDPLQVDGPPIEFITLNPGSRNIWTGIPPATAIESQFIEGNETRSDGRLQRKQALVRGFYDNRIISEDQMKKWLEESPMGMVGVDPAKLGPDLKSLSDVIHLVQPHVQQEYWQYQKELLQDSNLLTGIGPNQFGTFAPGRRTKHEAQLVDETYRARTGLIRQDIAQAIARHANRINTLVSKYWKARHIAKILGVDGALYWVQGNPAEFGAVAAQLVSTVNVESLAPTSRDRRRQEMVEVLGVIAKFQGMEQFILPTLINFLSSFEWSEVHNALPLGQQPQGPFNMQQFQAQQQGMMQNPQLPQMVEGNLRGAMPQLLAGGDNG